MYVSSLNFSKGLFKPSANHSTLPRVMSLVPPTLRRHFSVRISLRILSCKFHFLRFKIRIIRKFSQTLFKKIKIHHSFVSHPSISNFVLKRMFSIFCSWSFHFFYRTIFQFLILNINHPPLTSLSTAPTITSLTATVN